MFAKIVISAVMFCITCSAQDMQQLKKTVAFIYGQTHVNGAGGVSVLIDGSLGTAFFVGYPDTRAGADWGFVYLVTAKHVLKDEVEGKYLNRVRLRANKIGSGLSVGEIPVSDSKGDLLWLDDKDDPNADVVATMIQAAKEVDMLSIPLSLFSSDDSLKKSRVSEGDAVYLVGLMPQFTGENRNYPVVRHGYIALLSDEPIPLAPSVKEKVYALELGSWPGQSGSPVFLSLSGYRNGSMALGESYSLLGLMLGFVPNQRPFETVSSTSSVLLGDTSNVGISYVLPASEILKVLNSKEAQQQRDANIQRMANKSAPAR
jgi:hypothetical protein